MSNNKTFRIFLSSTFNDLRAERDKLQAEVFPRLRKYCEDKGFSFQPIDLRWGVSSEAGFDQKTMQICIDEVKRCKNALNPHFAIMLGERYGWIPLPASVKKEEFELVKNAILKRYANNQEVIDMINHWYKLDTNAIENLYMLQIRTGIYEDWNQWGKIENTLRDAFMTVVKEELSDELTEEQKFKYIKSATEQEIIEGLFENESVAKENIFFYNRDFTNLDKITETEFEELEKKDKEYRKKDSTYTVTIKQFSDFENFNGNRIDRIIRPHHELLINKIKENLPKDNIKEYPLILDTNLDRTQDSVTDQYLEQFAKDFEETMFQAIKKEIENYQDVDSFTRELDEQKAFLDEKSKIFVGRTEFLTKIDNYISNDTTNKPLIIYANSGSGKSSLMAKAISNSIEKHPSKNIIYRFVGTSELSNNPINLYKSIYNQLCQDENTKYIFEGYIMQNQLELDFVLSNIKELDKMFANVFQNGIMGQDVVLFIDALDQFVIDDSLDWLPKNLHENIKVIISTLPNDDYEDIKYLPKLRQKYQNNPENFLFLEPFDEKEANSMINEYLSNLKRTITPKQKNKILEAFLQNKSPLYLKILLEEANEWKSYDCIEDENYPKNLDDLITRLFNRLNSKCHHSMPLIEYAFSYIACSKDGISEPELFDILSNETRLMDDVSNEFYPRPPRLPTAVWARLYSQISHYMTIKEKDGIAQINFFHRKFNEASYKLLGKKQAHQNLANFYEKAYNKELEVATSLSSILTQLPYQLTMSNQKQKTKELLTNFEFLMQKFKLNKTDEIFGDYELVKKMDDKY
jgi:hypothetical protein